MKLTLEEIKAHGERQIALVKKWREEREAAEAAALAAAEEAARPGAEGRARLEQLAREFGPQDRLAPTSPEERRELFHRFLRGWQPSW